MDFIMTLLVTIMIPIWYIFPSRIISMTFNTFSRSITIKNDKWAKLLIAEKNVRGIAANPRKKNKMSIWGVIGYMIFLPQVVFMPCIWWKLKEAIKFSKGGGFIYEIGRIWVVCQRYGNNDSVLSGRT